MKSYTDIEQSKKLAEFLPLESADMCHNINKMSKKQMPPITTPYSRFEEFYEMKTPNFLIPCWSLAALLNILPQEVFNGEYIINITEGHTNKWILTYDHYENEDHSYYDLFSGSDNLVDACVEMIIKLKELRML